MQFTLQKMIWYVYMPPISLIMMMLVGLAVSRKRRKTGLAGDFH